MNRAGLGALALLLLPPAVAAQSRPRAHMEACTEWKYPGSTIGARNDCNRPITIQFMALGDPRVVEADVEPGGWFDSGAGVPATHGYLFTVCPMGFVSSVTFAVENRALIRDSLYNCLPRDRPGV